MNSYEDTYANANNNLSMNDPTGCPQTSKSRTNSDAFSYNDIPLSNAK